ncbi:MAG: 30S ribosomal protein S20 [Burkholderiaceae bacterium]|nr:30S ribosomal protein S20 [Burkholderiaceae bacterium]
MSLGINNNITALNAWRQLKTTDRNISGTMEKLSSGLKINRAADDPAGLVISEKMRAQLVGLEAASKNVEKAVGAGDKDKAVELFAKMQAVVDSIADKGIFHKNKAARDKSRLSAKVKALATAA